MALLQLNNPSGGRPLKELPIEVNESGMWIIKLGYTECEKCGYPNNIEAKLQMLSMLTEMAQNTAQKEVVVSIRDIIAKMRTKMRIGLKTA